MKQRLKGTPLTAAVILFLAALVGAGAAHSFIKMWSLDPVYPAAGFVKHYLSEWEPSLKGSYGDTEVFIQEGDTSGGTVLILGGTHPNEPASNVTAVLFLERAKVKQGRLIVVPWANRSAFSHNSPQDASPQYFHIPQKTGARVFHFGSRSTNPIHQWPNPDIYIHQPSGQRLAGSARSNLNRGYPGRNDDGLTQRVAGGILSLIRKEKVTLAFDLHEASPEYPVVNAIVAHQKAIELAAEANMELEIADIPIRVEPSPVNLRGLSHREWGDASDTLAILMETGNPSQGRLRGRTDEALVLTGKDKAYTKAAALGRLFIPYAGEQPLSLRVARHTQAIEVCVGLLPDTAGEDKAVDIGNIPDYEEIVEHGIGYYLAPAKASTMDAQP